MKSSVVSKSWADQFEMEKDNHADSADSYRAIVTTSVQKVSTCKSGQQQHRQEDASVVGQSPAQQH